MVSAVLCQLIDHLLVCPCRQCSNGSPSTQKFLSLWKAVYFASYEKSERAVNDINPRSSHSDIFIATKAPSPVPTSPPPTRMTGVGIAAPPDVTGLGCTGYSR